MKKIKFSIKINAPKEKVWEALWKDANYRKWTSTFIEGSHAVSTWNEGSSIYFMGPDNTGMFSIIEKKIPNQQMIFKHLGEINKDGVKEAKDWGGILESYFLTENNGITELNAEVDSNEEFEKMFTESFPKGLQIVKEIAEGVSANGG